MRFQNWDLKSSLSKFPSIHCLNISEDLDLTDLKKDIGKQYKETGDTTYITVALLFTHALFSWHSYPQSSFDPHFTRASPLVLACPSP